MYTRLQSNNLHIFSCVLGHDKKIKSLNENVYIVNAARLFKNILVLGYDEEKLNAKINATQLSNGDK